MKQQKELEKKMQEKKLLNVEELQTTIKMLEQIIVDKSKQLDKIEKALDF